MAGNLRGHRVARLAVIGAIAALAAVGCSTSATNPGGSKSPAGAKQQGGTVSFAFTSGEQPDYIFPFVSIANISVYTSQQFQYLLYRPLYFFGANDTTSVTANYALSPANAPVYHGNTVTIGFKGWKWSDGETVDAKDLVFWLNMMEAEKANFYGYVPGLMPDNLVTYSATGPETVSITTKQAYSSLWFTYNQLGMLTPMPMAWDVTSLGAAPGSGGCATDSAADKWANCVKVYNFLTAQAKISTTYATSPLWSVVDGPWKLKSYSADGNDALVPNPAYSGSPKPSISELDYKTYTDDSAEFTALKTQQVDIAQVPDPDLVSPPAGSLIPSVNPLAAQGYNLVPWVFFGYYYMNPNFNGPNHALWRQLYIRQAMQELIDQPGWIKAILHGIGYPEAGSVPTKPVTQWLPQVEQENNGIGPYAFSIAAAKALLAGHGWTEVNGVMTCQSPAKCGAGIAQGQKMAFTLDNAANIQIQTEEAQTLKSDASQAGVAITVVNKPFNVITSEDTQCAIGPKCTWDITWFGGWTYDGPGWAPTGEPLFATGAGSNIGNYSDPHEDSLIQQTETSSDMGVFNQFATYTAEQLPYIWVPNMYFVMGVNSKLGGVVLNPEQDLLPEYWYWTK